MKTLYIDPVPRIDGDSRLLIEIDEGGVIKKVEYQTLGINNFYHALKNRLIEEIPRIITALCGSLSYSHYIASTIATENILGREPPEYAVALRALAVYTEVIEDHIRSFYTKVLPKHMGSIDISSIPDYAINMLEYLRGIKQVIGGKPIHPVFAIPGGVSRSLVKEELDKLKKLVNDLGTYIERYRSDVRKFYEELLYTKELREYSARTYNISLVNGDKPSYIGGRLVILDPNGNSLTIGLSEYSKYIEYRYTPSSTTRIAYLREKGWHGYTEETVVRTGALARVNIASSYTSREALEERNELVETYGSLPVHSIFFSPWAQLVDVLEAYSRIRGSIDRLENLEASIANLEGLLSTNGIGIVDSPRGLIIHNYSVNDNLLVNEIDITTATEINIAALNTDLNKYGIGKKYTEKLLSTLYQIIYFYSPCSTGSIGR